MDPGRRGGGGEGTVMIEEERTDQRDLGSFRGWLGVMLGYLVGKKLFGKVI
jgi:hypothetical protein